MTTLQPAILPEAFFLPTQHGSCFCLFHAPQGNAKRGGILYLHPFAEEINTTRRIVAHQARCLAQLGYGVLQIDLFGCGDSAGEFKDASWSIWLQTARAAHFWLQENTSGPLWLWGLRAGALLAGDLVNQLQNDKQQKVNLLLWQPVTTGEQMLQQFLRLSQAGDWIGTRNAEKIPAKEMLAHGQTVEIAGYSISAEMAHELAYAHLRPVHSAQGSRLVWLEVSSHNIPMLSPASEKSLDRWNKAGWKIESEAVSGTAFWQTINMVDVPSLWQATHNAMCKTA